ncbi:hypothetical protein J2W27_003601 [Variovorax boronicumulans]|uniref:T6SS phospholipase effector Tle1-like catalytic domain-containing protein n=1 Tax=Variovorax boronicumulans TaxID=436515 RepID=UPI002781CD46|nr:DUF2235 domain-containing protein [Variovorax boronicumulans]MDP9911477.1 hypothetical protein [Variovorax boronicumulans]
MSVNIESALNPALGKTRSRERPLSNKEQMQRVKAVCSAAGDPTTDFKGAKLSCSGDIFIGLFFDGTGNNEVQDFVKPRKEPRQQKHSNVVRLYHAFPTARVGTTGYYRYYIPGVGTPFDKIGDDGVGYFGKLAQKLGSIAAWNGEPRIIWGLTRVFNAVSQYVYKGDIIDDETAGSLADQLSSSGLIVPFLRRRTLKDEWQTKLKAALKNRTPQVTQINLSVYGFSRGAAEARAFVNWFYELCEEKGQGWEFAGIPVRLQFLGIFDTVSSVGAAGLYSIMEGRQSWAWDNMQIHKGVEQCLHLVAGQEVRACFPLDSVRIDGKYPPNAKEYVYPGSHSDVGGGYMPMCLGKNDWVQDDRQLARIPGYEMYCAAIEAGVPFLTEAQLAALDLAAVTKALVPHSATVAAFNAYYKMAGITPGPVEMMHRQHMSWYFTHRWKMLDRGLQASPEWARASTRPNQGENYDGELDWLRATQRALIQVVAAILEEIDSRMAGSGGKDDRLKQPLAFGFGVQMLLPLWAIAELASTAYKRGKVLEDGGIQATAAALARKAPEYVTKWRRWLQDNLQAEVHDTDMEREPLLLLESLKADPVPAEISTFFLNLVHDSMAGFIGFGMPEFQANGFGIAKFRRIYFGNRGDAVIREAVEARNKQQISIAKAKRAQRAQWDLEAANYQRANPRPW